MRENLTGSARAGAMVIAGRIFTVIQDGGPGAACTYSISPRFADFTASGGAGTINLTASGQCAWQATSNVNWITVTGNSAGIGSGAVTFTVSANPGGGRAGMIRVAGQTFSVKQKGS